MICLVGEITGALIGMAVITNCVSENRVGRFRITNKVIEERPDVAMYLFSKMVIVWAENMFPERSICYCAYSPLFDAVPESVVAPEYDVIVHTRFDNETGREVIEIEVRNKSVVKEEIRYVKVKKEGM